MAQKPDEPPRHQYCTNCGGDNPAIRKIADELDFSYDEAFAYVITVGLAYAYHPPQIGQEPGE